MKLTKTKVEALPVPPAGQALYWDEELKGFGVRVTSSGLRSYVAQGRVRGLTRRVTIGAHGRWTPDEARKQARERLRDMDLGVDPQGDKLRDRALSVTLNDVATEYMAVRDLKDSSKADIQKHLRTTLGTWRDRPVASISRDECLQAFMKASERGPAQANQAFVILRALLNFARARHRLPDGAPALPDNPVQVLSDTKLWNRQQARTGRVPLDRLGAVLDRLQEYRGRARTHIVWTSVDYLVFLLTTGARATEAGSLRWSQVDLESDVPTWHLPDPKNRRAVTFPLGSVAADLLVRRKLLANGEFVFPCPGKVGFIQDARGVLEIVSREAGLHITRHDLRRTFTAAAIRCGVDLWKTELLTGHVPQTVTLRHYLETSDLRYLQPEIEAINSWMSAEATSAEQVRTGRNVLPLRA